MTTGNGTIARVTHLEDWRKRDEPRLQALAEDVAVIKNALTDIRDDVREIRAASLRREAEEKRTARYWITTVVAIVMTIIAAATLVISQLPEG